MEQINTKRRTFLKWLLFGAGAFALGKIIGPSINFFSPPQTIESGTFKNFRVVENTTELKLYDRFGNEIFIIEK